MAEIVGEDCGAETWRETDADILILAFCGGSSAMGRSRHGRRQYQYGRRKDRLHALV
jgi:hypothetical protein